MVEDQLNLEEAKRDNKIRIAEGRTMTKIKVWDTIKKPGLERQNERYV